jgi:hypothetical protein
LRRLILLGMTCGALLAPSAASAATLSFSGTELSYTASPGEANNLTTSLPAPGFCAERAHPCLKVEDSGAAIVNSAGADCTAADSGFECRVPVTMRVSLGDGDDTLFDWDGPSTVDGGTGADALDGGAGDDVLAGGIGNDTLLGEIGDDRMDGGPGDDAMEGFGTSSGDTGNDTSGRDVYVGGAGTDLVDYTARTDALTLDLDGAADDGGAGEGDTLGVDVERLYAGSGNDTLTGNAGANWLYGYGGADRLVGGTGDDILKGGADADDLSGEDGSDELMGEDGGDRLDGGRGLDAFDGDSGFRGADTILARDGAAETINCGAGADAAVVDASDTTLFNNVGDSGCESVDRPASGGAASGTQTARPGGTTTPAATRPGTARPGVPATTDRLAPVLTGLRATPGRRFRLTVRFRLSEAATVTLRLQRRAGRRYRSVPGSVRHAGRSGANVVRLPGRRLRPGRYRLVVTVVDAAGNRAAERRLAVRVRR